MCKEIAMLRVLVFLVLVCVSAYGRDHRHLRSVLGSLFEPKPPTVATETTVTGAKGCEGCSKKITVVDDNKNYAPGTAGYTVTEEEFTALRIEYIKNQILKKLRLKKKPKIAGAHLPKAVTENEALLPRSDEFIETNYFDDFYGKTTQAIVFPYEDDARCDRKKRFPSACLPFQMPSDIHATEVSTAELWFHKEADELDSHNQTFVVSEVAHWDSNRSFQKTKPIAIRETNLTEGWLKIDVTYVIRNWLEYQDSPTHAINVACKTCGMDSSNSPISFKNTVKPFLVIYTHSQARRAAHRRQKRSSDCGNGIRECCREKLYVSFAEIGWDDWILQPPGYNAYFCKGSCTTAASLTLSATQHNNILQKVMYSSNKSPQARLELTPCCAATQFQPLELLYLVNNKTVQKKILPNMIVDACGCM